MKNTVSNLFQTKISSHTMNKAQVSSRLRFVDFFCGIGGFHLAAASLGMECVFASDIDAYAQEAYKANFGFCPAGDINNIKSSEVPDHDLLFAGFPCQPFSIIGKQNGFSDPRGILFFELLRIIKKKRPAGFVLENVKQLATSDNGRVIEKIMEDLHNLGYEVDYKILNALDFGVPQKRERTIIVGTLCGLGEYEWPNSGTFRQTLSDVLEQNPTRKVYVSKRILDKRLDSHTPAVTPAIWHENKSGNISSHPFSCALRAGASYNYLLVNGERRLTSREMLRLQGFPDTYKIVCSDSQTRKQVGNAVAVPVVKAVIERIANVVRQSETERSRKKTA